MARPIDSTDAKRMLQAHQNLLTGLQKGAAELSDLRLAVKTATDKLAQLEAVKVLATIPVEEINRDKRGFRIKTLRDHGYENIADLAQASPAALSRISGISDEAAREIKTVVREIVAATQKNVKIRLSLDDRTVESTNLVRALNRFMGLDPHGRVCKTLLEETERTVTYGLEDLKPATSGLRWLFASQRKKERAMEAYTTLSGLLEGPYGQQARSCLNGISKAKRQGGQDAWEAFAADPIRFFNALEDIVPGVLGSDDELYGLPEELATQVDAQEYSLKGLNCQLRRYQQWGVKYVLRQQRVLLGDEMGLGKTVQAIASMVALRNAGSTHFLVVCPASVLTNWCREVGKMSDLSVTKIHGDDRDEAVWGWVQSGGVGVTTYETTKNITLPKDVPLALMVVDEAHYIKNPGAQRTKSVRILSRYAQRLLFMTGTALENRVEEMIELIKLLQPEVAQAVHGIGFLSTAPEFRKKIAPVYYRRKRDDVLTELPELIENRQWCTLTPEEEHIYEQAILEGRYADARRVSWNVPDVRRSSKANRLLELLEEAKEEGRKVIVFSFFLDTIQKVCQLAGDLCYGPINGSIPPQRRQEIIDEFDKAPAGSVLAAQILAGGTGLNIQSASVVVICEPQFKPSTESQAVSRAYRMGQTRNVLVYRLLCDETIDEQITTILEEKQAIFDAFADKSDAAERSPELDETTFRDMMQAEAHRIQSKRNEQT